MDIKDILDEIITGDGVISAVVLGRDGVALESSSRDTNEDPESIAALSRDAIIAAERMTSDLGKGNLIMGILELSRGIALIANISRFSKLIVLAQRGSNLAELWNLVGSKFASLRQLLQL
jgi:predicted regulator of Ras-like GTPase activity (Roadblock/LC7/MglB family)